MHYNTTEQFVFIIVLLYYTMISDNSTLKAGFQSIRVRV